MDSNQKHLSLVELKDLNQKARLLYAIAKADKVRPYYKTYHIGRAIKSLLRYDRYFAIEDENGVYYGGFLCDKNVPHIAVNKKVRGKWGHLLKQFITILLEDYGEIKFFVEKNNRQVDNLIMHLEKKYMIDKTRSGKNLDFYTVSGGRLCQIQ